MLEHSPGAAAPDDTADRIAPRSTPVTPPQAGAVVRFWRDAGPSLWFAKDPAFDRHFRDSFLDLHEAASRGLHDVWLRTAKGALGLVLLLDQFPRNAFRGTPRMYSTDVHALRIAGAAVDAGYHRAFELELAIFLCLPFAHSEALADQERSVALARELNHPDIAYPLRYLDIIRRFGRFPHRNPILGRAMTAAEQAYLEGGFYAG
ncbi:DUF924 family protein [Plastoroseomonas arctica]|uniref:DUF924 family protein n=1 Tax=Plastoroseomonas arctica TaxID=1509237 RepID=A0AAF1JVE9_9PROT|nr:DUF924 family protein [Plastoroseomonas arctica]MBR0654535.1 DUF924 family protein [Plastoroseomonas arctica]